jgi:hypothetical protein
MLALPLVDSLADMTGLMALVRPSLWAVQAVLLVEVQPGTV